MLVILLPFTDWSAKFGSHNVVNLALVAACARLTLLGGITLMFLEQDPRRIRGVLGFVLVNVMLGAVFISLIQHFLVQGWAPALPTVKFLVEGDGGTLGVQNSPGRGCRFLISYPQAQV